MDIKLDHSEAKTNEPDDLLQTEQNRIVIIHHGDLLIEYVKSSYTISWQVSSQALRDASPYFEVLLDPEKFKEGISIAQQQNTDENLPLPIFRIPYSPFMETCDSGPITLFFKSLCFKSMSDSDRVRFEAELKEESPPRVAKMIDIAEWFNSPDAVRAVLNGIKYSFGKVTEKKTNLLKFDSHIMRMKEDLIRQIILIAYFLRNTAVIKTMTHALIFTGSRYWIDGLEAPEDMKDRLRWHYLPFGIEEELYYRRQCVLSTITDLQAHFLRVYGGLDSEDVQKSAKSTQRSLGVGFSTSVQTTQFQCRAGLANGSQCDIFQLGQLMRFLILRSKTAFIGSTLIDPEFGLDTEGDKKAESPSSLSSILDSLKSVPDYQIDSHHGSCGVRRRMMPIIPCIEKYVMHPRAVLGIGRVPTRGIYPSSTFWNISLQFWSKSPKYYTANIHFDNVISFKALDSETTRSLRGIDIGQHPERDAELLFTVKKRNWET